MQARKQLDIFKIQKEKKNCQSRTEIQRQSFIMKGNWTSVDKNKDKTKKQANKQKAHKSEVINCQQTYAARNIKGVSLDLHQNDVRWKIQILKKKWRASEMVRYGNKCEIIFLSLKIFPQKKIDSLIRK